MRYFHNSKVEGLRLENTPRYVQPLGPKPRGFWFDVDGDWLRWVLGEGYETDGSWHKPYWYEIVLPPRLCYVGSVAALDEFTKFYAVPIHEAPPAVNQYQIDWPRLAAEFDGIVIAPYQWSRRNSLMWYYGWDCASGCIWRNQDRVEIKRVAVEVVRGLWVASTV